MRINCTSPLATVCILLLCCSVLLPLQSEGQTSVTTYRYDNSRSGVNSQEAVLSPFNVTASQFGKWFSQSVDGYIFAQPLYVPNLAIPGRGTHNVVFVATETDKVYAFDADSNQSALWSRTLIDTAHGELPMNTPDPSTGTSDVTDSGYAKTVNGIMGPKVGITSTPVIDLSSNRMYVVTKSKYPDPSNPANYLFIYRLHALDITTGVESIPPVPIQPPSSWQGVPFNPLYHLNRSALLLSNGTVYVTFASHGDWQDQPPQPQNPLHSWYGWMFAYAASSLSQKAYWVATPSGKNAGIWMSGAGPAADASGNIFLATGNGDFGGIALLGEQNWDGNFGTSILKLASTPNIASPNGNGLQVFDYFTPYNQSHIGDRNVDLDLGAGGVLLLPDQVGSTTHRHLLLLAGKDGTIYLVDRDNMGQFCTTCTTTDTNIVQEIPSAFTSNGGPNFYGMPVYWNQAAYFWGINDYLKAFSLNNGVLSTSPVQTAADRYGPIFFPGYMDTLGANPTVSADGSLSGIVWSLSSEYFYPLGGPDMSVHEVLRAHDASNLSLLYSSGDNSNDNAGLPVKFAVPTVANAKVYVGAQNQLTVYGLFSTLTVNLVNQGGATGSVTSNPAGINCGATCTARFPSGSTVTLTAAPSPGATVSWSVFSCSGLSCTVTFSVNSSITATFSPAPPPAPSISSLSATAGGAGALVTISGANFGNTQGGSTVTFNGTTAKINSWNGNSISASVPLGATTGNVVVKVGSQTSNGVSFNVQDDALHTFAVNCSTCGAQVTDFSIQNSPLYGYTIQSGDTLYFYQKQSAGSVAGITLCFLSGDLTLCDDDGHTVDQNGQPIHADTIQGVTHFRKVDLTPSAGLTIAQIAFHSTGNTQPGRWDVYYGDVQIVSANGTVRPIFVTGSTPSLYVYSSDGVTQQGSAIEHAHIW
ncbi:MAG TPA: IPT/TIG domain-containing protein [Candidatus Angelobacter sp.]